MSKDKDDSWMIPEEIKQEFALIAAKFRLKTNVPVEDVTNFMVDVIKVYTKYLDTVEKVN